jgi:hypothetical protein
MEIQAQTIASPRPYAEINATWPKEMKAPTGKEAIKGARLLIREGFRFHGFLAKANRKRIFRLTSGNRRTRFLRGIWQVNPDLYGQGWRYIVHSISHHIHFQVHPTKRPHEFHALTERHLIEYVLAKGWLEGGLKCRETVKPIIDVKAKRAALVALKLKRWETKRKRAETAIKKLKRQAAHYARTLN